MKNSLLYLVVIIFGIGQMSAQQATLSIDREDVSFGAKAGFNISSLGGSEFNYDTKAGFHVGGVLEIPFGNRFLIQPEALLSLQGSDALTGAFISDNDIKLFYLNVPLMVKYRVWDNLHIEAGPQIGLLLSSNIDEDTYGTTVSPDKNSIDIGLGLGAGYRLNENFYFQLRFAPGFVDVVKDINSKNRVLQISAIYFL